MSHSLMLQLSGLILNARSRETTARRLTNRPNFYMVYTLLLKTSYGILRFLNFDWFTRSGIWAHIPLTTNLLGVSVFFAMIVANFEVFLWVFCNRTMIPHLISTLGIWDGRYWLSTISHPTRARGIIVKYQGKKKCDFPASRFGQAVAKVY